MKKTTFQLAIILFAGIIVFYSCKKETSCEGCRETNKPPIAIAGPDQVITLPTDSISLDGSSSNDPDGTISEWIWRKISGPAYFNVIHSTDSMTWVKALVPGIYQFELSVKDNGGLSAKDTMQVTVNDGLTNRPPIANAGSDTVITLPENTVNLDGSRSSDPDNNITSNVWTKISGPSLFAITNANAVQTQVTNLAEGIYQFELKVTDAGGLFSRDTLQVTVKAATTTSTHWTLISRGDDLRRDFFWSGGGFFGIDENNVFAVADSSRKFYKYDFQTGNWVGRGTIPYVGAWVGAVSGKGYFMKGVGTTWVISQYDPVTDQWTQKNNAPVGCQFWKGYSQVVSGSIYYLGRDGNIWRYNVVADTFTQGAHCPLDTLNASFVVNDEIYFLNNTQCYKYNPSTNSWQKKATPPSNLFIDEGFSVNNHGYILSSNGAPRFGPWPISVFRYEALNDLWIAVNDNYPGWGSLNLQSFSTANFAFVGFGWDSGFGWYPTDLWTFKE